MASVNTLNSLMWLGTSDVSCEESQLIQYKNKIEFYYEISQSGSGAKVGSPTLAEFLAGDVLSLKCGVSSLLFSEQTGYDIPHGVIGDLSTDLGRIICQYDQTIDISNLDGDYQSANGLYKLTTFFKNNKPTYFNENGWWIWWNGTDWSLTDSIQNPTKILNNGDPNPKGGVWDCNPSCQQGGRGPESPPASCIPSSHDIIEYSDVTITSENLGTVSFNDAGLFGVNKADFTETQGLPRLMEVNAPDGFTLVDVTLQAWPPTNSEPMIYFECTSSFCNGECYSGKLTKIVGTDNWRADLSLV